MLFRSVAANRLGVINHTLLTVAAIRAGGLKCAGVVLNHPHAPQADDPAVVTNAGVLGELLAALPGGAVRLLGEIEFGAETLPAGIVSQLR